MDCNAVTCKDGTVDWINALIKMFEAFIAFQWRKNAFEHHVFNTCSQTADEISDSFAVDL